MRELPAHTAYAARKTPTVRTTRTAGPAHRVQPASRTGRRSRPHEATCAAA